jgi:membrane-bound metal-dependent hydrolase YbcI (DUF457 family)
MTTPTHLAAGLLIGRITGHMDWAILAAVLVDLDHVFSYVKHGVLFKPKQLIKTLTDVNDPWDDQRGIMHNFFVAGALSLLMFFLMPTIGLTLVLS